MSDEEPTRRVRRGFYLASAPGLMLEELQAPGADTLRVIVRHLEMAWDDGARREADLRTAVEVERVAKKRLEREVESLRRQLHEVLKRISDER